MVPTYSKYEVDHHILKLIVGLIALLLANATAFFAATKLTSISASYHEFGWPHDIFVGSLFAIAAFLVAYNGASTPEMVLSKTAAVAAMGVAMFPCLCDGRVEFIPYVHAGSAAVMFLVLAGFCLIFYLRAKAKKRRRADWRAYIYAGCGIAILLAIAVLAYDGLTGGSISSSVTRLTFYGERAGLIAFGISWLVASRVLPGITAADERVRVLPVAKGPAVQPVTGAATPR
jgi:hypothetical protein